MINIPNTNKQWSQANNSDLFGNISVTKNISFDEEGYLKLSASPRVSATEALTDFNNPAAVIPYSYGYDYLTATWDEMFTFPSKILTELPVKTTAISAPSSDAESDLIWFGGLLVVTQDNDVFFYTPDTNTWADADITLTGTGQHPMVVFLSQNALAIANVNTVGLYANPISTSPSLIRTLTIPTDFEITGMCYLNQNLYISTENISNGHAFMFVWNGSGSAAQQAYEIDSTVLYNVVTHKNTVYGVSGNGSLLRFNGGGFDVVAAFPVFYTDQTTFGSSIAVYKNTIKSNGDVLYILFSNRENDEKRLLNQPDGVWCYDEKVGLYHKYSLSNAGVIVRNPGTAGVDITENTITVVSPGIKTGTEVYYSCDSTVIGGLADENKYFAIYVDATHIKLATTKADAIAGTAIDLTSTGSAGNKFVFYPNVDFGQSFVEKVTTVNVIEKPVPETQYGGDIIWGAEIVRRDNTGQYGTLGTVSDGVEARGYFITPKILSTEITDTFNLLTLKYSTFLSELDKIVIKYRTEDDMKVYADLADWGATWTSTTTFTSTQAEWANASVGDEIEVLRGAAGGLLAHITDISVLTGTYTITIDETFEQYTTGDISVIIFRNWTKFAVIDSTGEGYLSQQLGVTGKFLQLKIELRGIGVRIEELLVDNKYQLPAKNNWTKL